jgi:DNA segregation ATPase FtsK/SpoIIIE, S-DNA-T family
MQLGWMLVAPQRPQAPPCFRKRYRPAMPNNRTVAAHQFDLPQLRRNSRAKDHSAFTDMKRTALRSLTLIAIVASVVGCQTTSRFAWWKHEKPSEDTSVVARSATPALPSAQSKPEAVAVAGLTPATPPSSSNLAAAGAPVGATAGATASLPPAKGGLGAASALSSANTPITSSGALANAPTGTYPTDNGLADKLVSTPSTRSTAAVPSAAAPPAATTASIGSVPAGGPYDPSAYKPANSLAASGAASDPTNVDRYGMSSASPIAASTAAPNSPPPLSSDPADRYGFTPTSAQAAAANPNATPLMDPTAVAADRYSNPTLPSMSSTPAAVAAAPAPSALPTATAAATSASGVKLASAPGQYRPGRTSSYSSSAANAPIEVASRPMPPAASPAPVTPATPAAAGTPSQPWTPPAPTAPATGTRTY